MHASYLSIFHFAILVLKTSKNINYPVENQGNPVFPHFSPVLHCKPRTSSVFASLIAVWWQATPS